MSDVSRRLHGDLGAVTRLIADLEADLAAIAETTAQSPDDEHDPEGATVGFERARVGALLDRARRTFAEIEGALLRCDEDGYEICERCGAPIGAERLDALPTTSRCINCAAN